MADKYYDASGKEIKISTQPSEQFYDYKGEPIKQLEKYKDPITAASEKVAPVFGRAAVEALPFAGSFFGAPGIAVGTALKTAAKVARPDLVGEPPQGFEGAMGDLAKEFTLNKLLPGTFSGLGRAAVATDMVGVAPKVAETLQNFPAVRQGVVRQMTEQINRHLYPTSGIIEQGAENAASRFGELRSSSSTDHLADVFGHNQVGQMLTRMQEEAATVGGDIARTQTYREIANKTLSDVIHVQNAKITAGPEFTNDIAVNRLLTMAGNPKEKTIDAGRAINELLGKNNEIYKEAMNPASYESLKKLLETMRKLEGTNKTNTLMNYSDHKLIYSGAGFVLGGGVGAATGLGIASALPITDAMLRKIMANPETAKLVTLALTTPAKAPQATLINKALTEVLPRIIQGQADLTFMPER